MPSCTELPTAHMVGWAHVTPPEACHEPTSPSALVRPTEVKPAPLTPRENSKFCSTGLNFAAPLNRVRRSLAVTRNGCMGMPDWAITLLSDDREWSRAETPNCLTIGEVMVGVTTVLFTITSRSEDCPVACCRAHCEGSSDWMALTHCECSRDTWTTMDQRAMVPTWQMEVVATMDMSNSMPLPIWKLCLAHHCPGCSLPVVKSTTTLLCLTPCEISRERSRSTMSRTGQALPPQEAMEASKTALPLLCLLCGGSGAVSSYCECMVWPRLAGFMHCDYYRVLELEGPMSPDWEVTLLLPRQSIPPVVQLSLQGCVLVDCAAPHLYPVNQLKISGAAPRNVNYKYVRPCMWILPLLTTQSEWEVYFSHSNLIRKNGLLAMADRSYDCLLYTSPSPRDQ